MSRTLRSVAGASVLALGLSFAPGAQAGPTNTPLPTFSNGGSAVHVYTAIGVVKNNNIETLFICTNVDSVPVNIGIEVFDAAGTLANSIASGNGQILNVGVGATVTIGTSGTAIFTEDTTIVGLPNLRNGSGRVVATTKNVSCTAMLVDELHAVVDPAFSQSPPPTIVHLPLVRVP
ncbi:MAG: hypothetical protein ACE5FG_13615 [Myxococcota bacterium]